MIHPHTMPAVPAYPIPIICRQNIDSLSLSTFTSFSSGREIHTIIQRTRERGQQTQHRKANAERRPEGELTFEFLLVPQSHDHLLVRVHLVVGDRDVPVREDGGDGVMFDVVEDG